MGIHTGAAVPVQTPTCDNESAIELLVQMLIMGWGVVLLYYKRL